MPKNQKEIVFEKKVNELIAMAEKQRDAEVAKVIRLLSDVRKEVAVAVATTEWQQYRLPEFRAAINRALREFSDRYGVDLQEAQRNFWATGIEMVDVPLRTVGISLIFPAIDTTALIESQKYSKFLVDNLGRDAAAKIYKEITMGLMGQKTPYDVMVNVGKNLKDKSIFTSICARAETITRTECGRILETASQLRLEAAAQVVPGMQKQWVHGTSSKVPRPTHVAAHGQVRDYNQPFDIGDTKLMHPHDPAGGAKETINCSCYFVPYHPDWGSAELPDWRK